MRSCPTISCWGTRQLLQKLGRSFIPKKFPPNAGMTGYLGVCVHILPFEVFLSTRGLLLYPPSLTISSCRGTRQLIRNLGNFECGSKVHAMNAAKKTQRTLWETIKHFHMHLTQWNKLAPCRTYVAIAAWNQLEVQQKSCTICVICILKVKNADLYDKRRQGQLMTRNEATSSEIRINFNFQKNSLRFVVKEKHYKFFRGLGNKSTIWGRKP